MKKEALLIVLILLVMFTAGCATATYKVGDKKFHTSEEALNEQAKQLSNSLAKVTPTNDPVHGTLMMVLPSDAEIQKSHIRYRGDTSKFSEEQNKFLITFVRNRNQCFVDAMRKRGSFDSVSVAYQNGNPASYPIGEYDYLMFVDVDGWFLRVKGNPKPLNVGTQGTMNMEPLEELARTLRSK